MPWHVRQLPVQDVLRAAPEFRAVGTALRERLGRAIFIDAHNRNSGALPTLAFGLSASQESWSTSRSLLTSAQRPRCGLPRHAGPGLQQDQPPAGWLWQPVLWPRAQRARIQVERCHCRFHWCCYVLCEECKVTGVGQCV